MKQSLVAQTVKNLPTVQESKVQSCVRKIPWRREWQPTPVFLLGKFHGQRSLAGYSPWGCTELDMTERLTFPPMSSVSPKLQYYSAIDRSPVSVLKKSQLLHSMLMWGRWKKPVAEGKTQETQQEFRGSRSLKQEEQRPPNLQQRVKGRGCWFQASHSYSVVSNSL